MNEVKEEVQSGTLEENKPQVSDTAAPGRGILRETFEIVKILLISLAIVLPIRYFIVQPFIVRGASMEPNYYDGQYLIIDEVTYQVRKPERGEVIVFRYPKDPKQFFIKRIIGLPGERVEILKGRVTIFNNDSPKGITLDEAYLSSENHPTYPEGDVTLSSTEYFLMGDNRDFSSDSRYWGPMDTKYMVGRALFRAWPLNSVGLVTQ
ncbi:MAG: signal peptidase I [bacterium]|nr:signal peptidase I [bacterium]MDZ4285684.1 signal peptidase I [Candidatus Sungbacteria bacterium]